MPSGHTNNFPRKWVWPRSRDPNNFGIRSNISPKLLELETSNLVRLCMGIDKQAHLIFLESERLL